jgi:hypothetical protein
MKENCSSCTDCDCVDAKQSASQDAKDQALSLTIILAILDRYG